MESFKRVFLIVCDSVGIGHAPDAKEFHDQDSNTVGNIARWCRNNNKEFKLPELCRLGLGELVPELESTEKNYLGSFAKLSEISAGKDTTTGHWEIAGTPLQENFNYYPEGFPADFLETWIFDNNLPGFLCNQSASGTTVIEEYGEESIKSGKPIVYTSSDSVFQIAAHEKHFGLENLYDVCQSARTMLDPLHIGRVIARPFLGEKKNEFYRTKNRKDFSYPPPNPNMLDLIFNEQKFVASVGKIDDIFAHRSFTFKNHTGDTETSQNAVLKFAHELQEKEGLVFANFIDFDQLYGHRRDPLGYANALISFDQYLSKLYTALGEDDLLLITADHGNDPTYTGSNHTREQVPLLLYSKRKNFPKKNLGSFTGFQHIAHLCLEGLGLESQVKKLPNIHPTQSLWKEICS